MRHISLFVFAAVVATAAFSQDGNTPDPMGIAGSEFLRRSEQIIKQAVDQSDSKVDKSDKRNIDLATKIAKEATTVDAQNKVGNDASKFLPPALGEHLPSISFKQSSNTNGGERKSLIFVSNSMSDDELKDAFEAAALCQAPVVFRGVLKGLSIDKTFMRAARIAKTVDGMPGMQIDSRPFQEFGVTTVPSVVVWEGGKYVKVAGTLSVNYATKRFEMGSFGDAGSRGTTQDIAEPDFVEEMQDRVSKIDFEAKKKAAISRFWTNIKVHPLPTVNESKTTYFDPTVVNKDDIVDPSGRLIAPGGSKFNPLDIVNFSKTIVVFDATDGKQIRFAKDYANGELMAGRAVLLLASNIDRSNGLKAMGEYRETLFPHHLFLLDDLVAERFGIQAVPSVIKQDGRLFKIQQISKAELK